MREVDQLVFPAFWHYQCGIAENSLTSKLLKPHYLSCSCQDILVVSLCDNDIGSRMSFCDKENGSRSVWHLSSAVLLSSCLTHCMRRNMSQ